ncbi:hypothetical protein BS50DRAFT_561605 [Corynespora cassiicola Philippines]|uniref:Zn(2)-C6 fungal-type domain-containing protein n=1 Tax=Corynespora cassiicola Philippines TaxID=1448308 RepID=A0A2T2NBD0_CORCC|nr:hypothetical protein BS50DRAFT_561605 [Corynespora cassiicola Philippines]
MQAESDSRKRPAPRGTAAYPRKRAVAACQTCRSRKTKCDNRRPACTFCERAGATCNYSSQDLSAYDPASLAILDRLDQLENTLKSHISSGAPQTFLGAKHILSWPVFQERFQSRANLVQLLRQSPPLDRPKSVNCDIDNETCKQLVEQCFQHVLSKNPVLEEEALRKTINRVCLNGVSWDADSCLALLVCAIGSIASPKSSDTDWAASSSYFGAAQRRIGMLMSWDGIAVPQCYFLAGVYFMYNLRPLEAWRMFAQAVVCIHPDNPETMPPGHYSLEECVYWSCWKSEVELRMILQLPSFGVIGNRYPPHIPEPPVTDAAHEPKWFYYLADISLRRLDMNIRETVATALGRQIEKGARYTKLARAVPTLEEQLKDWAKSMPDVFNMSDTEESVLDSILKGRLLDSYDILYIPFLEAVLAADVPHGEAVAVMETYARKALECCVGRMTGLHQRFTIRHHGTWLMLQTCMRSALLILAARVAGHSDLLPEGWGSAVSIAATALAYWKEESPDVQDRFDILRMLGAECGVDIPA